MRVLTVLLFALLIHVSGTWNLPLIDRDEPRFAEASREMLQRHDFIIPYFNNFERFDKPPLIYWMQCLSFRLFGETDFAARLPSVLFATLTALIIYFFGVRNFANERIGFWGALIFSVSLQTLIHAKSATADMSMVCFVTLAFWSGWEMWLETRGLGTRRFTVWWWTFYFALAAGFLAKGPVAFLPAITIGIFQIWMRVQKSESISIRWDRTLVGICFTAGLISLWGVPALIQSHGRFWDVGIGKHIIQRSFRALEGHGAKSWWLYLLTLPFYLITVGFSFFPWSLYLPAFTRFQWRRMSEWQPLERYLVSGIILTLLIFTFLTTKLPHYILPALPLLSLLMAAFLLEIPRWEDVRKRWVCIMTGLIIICTAIIFPLAGRYCFLSPRILEASRDWLKPEMEFRTVDYREPSLVWYFRSIVKGWEKPLLLSEVTRYMDQPGPRFCILTERSAIQVASHFDPRWKSAEVSGVNLVHGWRPIKLVIWVKED